jgi:hypothetical protein
MLQVSSASALTWFAPSVEQALAVPGIAGLSLRAPWTSITSNLDIFDAGLQLTQAAGVGLAIRFISGVDTPAQDLGNSTILAGSGGQSIPLPWGAGSTPTSFVPNTAFEAAYASTVQELAAFARAHGVHELHLPWYSGPTAEIYLGPEIESAPGYSMSNFLTGYERLIDIGMSVAGPDLTVEFPMSGIGTGGVVGPLEQYIASRYGRDPGDLILQWNDLTDSGGSEIASNGFDTGRQMLGQGDYNWPFVYQTLESEGSTTLEVYLQSFAPSLAHAEQLRQEVSAFAAIC